MVRRTSFVKPLGILLGVLLSLVFQLQAQHRVQCDALGNTYDVCNDHITKHSSNFNIDFRLSTLQYGTSALLDLTNPMVPFLFFEDQGSLVFFDNALTVLEDPVFLNERFQGQITCVAGSKGDAFWMWDANSSTLFRTNRQFEVLSESANLSYLLKTTLQPKQIIESGQRVYLVDAEKGILLFSIFGNLEFQTQTFSTKDPVYRWNDGIYFRMENTLYEWKNNEAAPRVLSYFQMNELNDKNTWLICEGELFYILRETGEMRKMSVLENLEK
jgi:hypothetical protein